MAAMQQVAKGCGKSHELAQALWEWGGGWYEVRTVAALVDEPERVTSTQMDRWCRDFDNWGICDTVCFHLFDRVAPALAFGKVDRWSGQKGEFQKRAAFALLGCLALHNKAIKDDEFIQRLPLIERGASDERNFVKKGVSWALRGIGRRGPELRAAAAALARRLAASLETTPRWVGKDALRDLAR
jgi:3-methyladenine DNA glycosylase AlkD